MMVGFSGYLIFGQYTKKDETTRMPYTDADTLLLLDK